MGCNNSHAADVEVRNADVEIEEWPETTETDVEPQRQPTSDELRQAIAGLTVGERHAECCICFDDLCNEEPIACFWYAGARTCSHFFHDACAEDVLTSSQKKCPLCRRDVDAKQLVPDVSADPDGWFRCVDVEGDGRLSRLQVVNVLVSQFPVDQVRLEAALPELWKRWDVGESGAINQREFVDESRGLLAFVRERLLHETVYRPGSRMRGASLRRLRGVAEGCG